MSGPPPQSVSLLSDPFLQLPEADGVRVVWFTEVGGSGHLALVGHWVRALTSSDVTAMLDGGLDGPAEPGVVRAETTRLSRLAEDADSLVPGRVYERRTPRPVWRHEAHITGLEPGVRVPYRVLSVDLRHGADVPGIALSDVFTLAPAPPAGAGQRVLITSDHQHAPMTPVNLAKVGELAAPGTEGGIDAVFCPGDMVNVADRASDWFDAADGRSFFPVLQGRADAELAGRRWRGAPLLQHVPLYPAIGNHEVMGRRAGAGSLTSQQGRARPRHVAEVRYAEVAASVNPTDDPELRERWLTDHSLDTVTYEEIFRLPCHTSGTPRYYATTVGNIRLVTACVAAIWRPAARGGPVPGRYAEAPADVGNPEAWGHGEHILEPIEKGSAQYRWLQAELASEPCQTARFRVVMFHRPPHGLGPNVAPAYTDPTAAIDTDPITGEVVGVRYEYPFDRDQLLRDVEPLLAEHAVHLVISGHTHIWNRFRNAAGVHFLESSNVGNTHGVCLPGYGTRDIPGPAEGYRETYPLHGDPGGLEPIVPTHAPTSGPDGTPQPFLSSNTDTAFSILDTHDGVVRSYSFDTSRPDGDLVLFDEFALE